LTSRNSLILKKKNFILFHFLWRWRISFCRFRTLSFQLLYDQRLFAQCLLFRVAVPIRKQGVSRSRHFNDVTRIHHPESVTWSLHQWFTAKRSELNKPIS